MRRVQRWRPGAYIASGPDGEASAGASTRGRSDRSDSRDAARRHREEQPSA